MHLLSLREYSRSADRCLMMGTWQYNVGNDASTKCLIHVICIGPQDTDIGLGWRQKPHGHGIL